MTRLAQMKKKKIIIKHNTKSQLELESILGEILPVFASSIVLLQLKLTKLKLEYLKFGF